MYFNILIIVSANKNRILQLSKGSCCSHVLLLLSLGNSHFTLFLLFHKRSRTKGHRALCTSLKLLDPRFSGGVSWRELGLHGGLLMTCTVHDDDWDWKWTSGDPSSGVILPPWSQLFAACTNTASVPFPSLGHKSFLFIFFLNTTVLIRPA